MVNIQAGYKVQPLSGYLKQPAPPAPPAVDYLKANAEIAKDEFWQLLDFALQYVAGRPRRGGNPREVGEHRYWRGQAIRYEGPFGSSTKPPYCWG